jgi:hypothetical protein
MVPRCSRSSGDWSLCCHCWHRPASCSPHCVWCELPLPLPSQTIPCVCCLAHTWAYIYIQIWQLASDWAAFDFFPATAAAVVKMPPGLLFDSSVVPVGWIRVGGVLFATFGAQYACAALIDWRLCRSAAASSMGAPDFPFSLPSSPRSRAVVAAAAAADGPPETQEMRCNLPYESLWHSSIGFYEASVPSRLALAALFAFLVASGQVGAGLLLLAVLNVVGAVSMAIALQRQWEVHVLGDAPKYKSSS